MSADTILQSIIKEAVAVSTAETSPLAVPKKIAALFKVTDGKMIYAIEADKEALALLAK